MTRSDQAALVTGVDEAGRGALAGPVTVAAVILDAENPIDGLADSKILTARRRELLFDQIITRARAFNVIHVPPAIIDDINVLQATLQGMRDAVLGLPLTPAHALIDGNQAPNLPMPCTTIIKGDAKEPCISAASILAKVSRDRLMCQLDCDFPQYGFARHKGYPTVVHRTAIARSGLSRVHRQSFTLKAGTQQ